MGANIAGVFIALEGTDGSGKTTQIKLLHEKLTAEGYDVELFDFPQYEKDSSFFAREYLNGKYGTSEDVGPYTGSLFFALDRYQAAPKIREALAANKIVLTNRYTGSNMAHQGTSFDNNEQLRGYFLWLDQMEFDLLKIPRPDISIVLRMPAEIAQKMVDKKPERSYTDKKRDIHEADLNHLKRSVEVYDSLCQLFPKDFKQIDCSRNGKSLEISQIKHLIWEKLKPILPDAPELKKKPENQVKIDNAFLSNYDGKLHITDAGNRYLANYISNTDSNVYVFNDELSTQTIAASMARLSRRSDSLKVTLLDEFSGENGQDEKLIQRVLTAYGDDSVQQLLGQHVVFENASNLLTKQLERGRLGAYLEQSTRYIYFDKKDKNGNYLYYIPSNFPNKIIKYYVSSMDGIFAKYSEIVRGVSEYIRNNDSLVDAEKDNAWLAATRAQACDSARYALPVATKSTVGIFASAQTIEGLITRLLSHELSECRDSGRALLSEVRKIYPAFYEKIDMPNRGLSTIAYKKSTAEQSRKLSDEFLAHGYGQSIEPVELTDYWPKNELDIVADILYENSNLSLREIRKDIEAWPMNKKKQVLETYVGSRTNRRQKPGRAFEKMHYSWDILCDYGIFRDLQRHRMVDDLSWQKLSPRFGYETPELIERAGFSETYQSCFDESLKLYSRLQADGYENEAQYATLLGHKMRWKVTINAREAFHLLELRTSPQGHPGYRKLARQMHEKLSEVHPLISGLMTLINIEENKELTRLDSERKTQQKLSSLS